MPNGLAAGEKFYRTHTAWTFERSSKARNDMESSCTPELLSPVPPASCLTHLESWDGFAADA